jgi:hypothetical protein
VNIVQSSVAPQEASSGKQVGEFEADELVQTLQTPSDRPRSSFVQRGKGRAEIRQMFPTPSSISGGGKIPTALPEMMPIAQGMDCVIRWLHCQANFVPMAKSLKPRNSLAPWK